MSQPAKQAAAHELSSALQAALDTYFGRQRTIIALERRPAPYRSSFSLEELDVVLEDETRLPIIYKDLSPRALLPEARDAKPGFLHDPQREIDTYRDILAPQRLGSPLCYGAVVDPQGERFWLFLERVDGCPLWQVGEIAVWQEAARWLAILHTRFAGRKGLTTARLLRHDADYYRLWITRAQAFAAAGKQQIAWLAGRYDDVVERLTALPTTFIHGEFYPSNILIDDKHEKLRVCPLDWEMVAVGPGLVDLAALTAGTWSADDRDAIVSAYEKTMAAVDRWSAADDFGSALDLCHLHLAVQWLGWSPNWTPPPEHAHGWLEEAMQLAEKLGL